MQKQIVSYSKTGALSTLVSKSRFTAKVPGRAWSRHHSHQAAKKCFDAWVWNCLPIKALQEEWKCWARKGTTCGAISKFWEEMRELQNEPILTICWNHLQKKAQKNNPEWFWGILLFSHSLYLKSEKYNQILERPMLWNYMTLRKLAKNEGILSRRINSYCSDSHMFPSDETEFEFEIKSKAEGDMKPENLGKKGTKEWRIVLLLERWHGLIDELQYSLKKVMLLRCPYCVRSKKIAAEHRPIWFADFRCYPPDGSGFEICRWSQ